MSNVIKTLYALIKALPIVVELLEMFAPNKKDTDSSGARKSDKDIIDAI